MNKANNDKTAVVLHSGGQDSTTCLAVASGAYGNVVALGFSYGQRHNVENKYAEVTCFNAGIPFKLVDVSVLGRVVESALLDETSNINAGHIRNPSLPASFVPVRNALFLTLAHGYAQSINADAIYTGVCQTDYSGYPDCREDFVKLLEDALNAGYEQSIDIITPLMHLNKAETFALADEYGILDLIINDTMTCYNGDTVLYAWGRGCDNCPACGLRKNGYKEFLAGKGK